MADNPLLLAGPSDDYDSQWTGPEIDDAVGRALPGGAIDEAITPKWLSTESYPPGVSVIHAGVLWTNVSEGVSTNVEPGTDMEVWYPKILDQVPSADLEDGSVTTPKLADAAVTWPKLSGDVQSRISSGSSGSGSNSNAFDNWYFPDPINQRGQASYTAAGYTIDRWILSNPGAGITLGTDGITVVSAGGEWSQRFEHIAFWQGRTVTISMLSADGTLHTGTLGAIDWVQDTPQTVFDDDDMTCKIAQIDTDIAQVSFTVKVAGLVLVAAKLEVSNHSTIGQQDKNGNWVLNEIPDYGEDLAKCQRYFISLLNEKRGDYSLLSIGVAYGAKRGRFVISLPCSMRAVPTLISEGMTVVSKTDTLPAYSIAVDHMAAASVNVNAFISANRSETFSVGESLMLWQYNNTAAKFQLSADL